MKETLRYIENTAKEVVRIGRFQRWRNDEIYLYNNRKIQRIAIPIADAFAGFLGPSVYKSSEEKNHFIPSICLLDMAGLIPSAVMAAKGLYWEAAATKLGYNILVQIAPDVASLAKRKIFHRI